MKRRKAINYEIPLGKLLFLSGCFRHAITARQSVQSRPSGLTRTAKALLLTDWLLNKSQLSQRQLTCNTGRHLNEMQRFITTTTFCRLLLANSEPSSQPFTFHRLSEIECYVEENKAITKDLWLNWLTNYFRCTVGKVSKGERLSSFLRLFFSLR